MNTEKKVDVKVSIELFDDATGKRMFHIDTVYEDLPYSAYMEHIQHRLKKMHTDFLDEMGQMGYDSYVSAQSKADPSTP